MVFKEDPISELRDPEVLRQTTNVVVMISPDHFTFNAETAENNSFMREMNLDPSEVKRLAMAEWFGVIETLEEHGITVIPFTSPSEVTPDAVFPNNWFTHHQDGTFVLYPMRAESRRLERQKERLMSTLSSKGILISNVVDLTVWEEQEGALEGTGSLVLDRVNKVAFAIESPRCSREAFDDFCRQLRFRGVFFHASDRDGNPIYHTNVIMGIGEKFAVIAPDTIPVDERDQVLAELTQLGKEIISITPEQVEAYAGNILELEGSNGPVIIMSESAFASYTEEQKEALSRYAELVPFRMPVIETIGGGSARCILAEIF